ncbi:hypothetical protein TNCV_346121 [Trichonephila clavipes]|nr:hypothetical protein TNCV_346121 [Trichonephila clavipes]
MYKNALKEDFIRVVENLDSTVEKKQKIELAKLQLAQLEKEVELQRAKNKALSLNPAAKVEEKQFETLNKETATHIGIREAEDWFRPIDLAKECDHAYDYPNVVSVSNVIENSSYDLPHVKNFNTRSDLSSLIKDYKCNKIKSTKLKMNIKLQNDIPVCQRARRLSCSEKLQILLWYPWKGKKEYVPLRTAYSQDSRYGMQPKARQSSRAGAAKTRTETFELVEEKQKLLDIREERTREVREQALPSAYHCQTYLPF